MYFRECERLASEQLDLAPLIKKVDGILRELPPASLVRPGSIAKRLAERESQVDGVLRGLADIGLLSKESMVECPQCETLMLWERFQEALAEDDEYLCTTCGTDLRNHRYNLDPVLAYRPRPGELHGAIQETAGRSAESSVCVNEQIPGALIERPFAHTPLLQYFSHLPRLDPGELFSDIRVLMVLHFLRDLVPFVEAMVSLGLNPANATLFYKPYPYPQRDAIKGWLESMQCRVLPVSQVSACLNGLNTCHPDSRRKVLIIEDGGYIVPEMHRCFPDLLYRTIGAVEQTTRGIINVERWLGESTTNKLAFPVLSVAGSKLKAEFEPKYIADASLSNMSRMFPHMAWRGKEVAVLGYGTVGQSVAGRLLQNGANVTAWDPSPEKRLAVQQQGGLSLTSSAAEAVLQKSFVFGASGSRSIDEAVIANLRHDTYLVSVSSDQYEIDLDELGRLAVSRETLKASDGSVIGTDYILQPDGRRVHVVANGYPVNFWGVESMPEQASDLILTLLLLSAVDLATGKCREPGIDTDAVNHMAAGEGYNIASKFLQMHSAKR